MGARFYLAAFLPWIAAPPILQQYHLRRRVVKIVRSLAKYLCRIGQPWEAAITAVTQKSPDVFGLVVMVYCQRQFLRRLPTYRADSALGLQQVIVFYQGDTIVPSQHVVSRVVGVRLLPRSDTGDSDFLRLLLVLLLCLFAGTGSAPAVKPVLGLGVFAEG